MPKSRQAQVSAAGALPVILIVFLVLVVGFILPLSPTLTVTFKISSPSVSLPQIEVVQGVYSKSPLWSTTKVTKGTIVITYLSGSQSPNLASYQLDVVISYKGQLLSTANYASITDGLYSMYTVYLPSLGEEATSPYTIIFTITTQSGYQSMATATLYPS